MPTISVTPAGSITLIKTPLESDYKNTFSFSSLSDQTTYFNGLISKVLVASDYTYMKKDGKIRVGLPIDTINTYNYCYYNNSGFTTKRYYCFIDRMEYVNENCTDIYIQTDVFQTWYFQIVWNKCFVEREHTSSDTVGEHTVPENVELGDYIGCDLQPTESGQMEHCYVVGVSKMILPVVTYTTEGDIPSGIYYIGCTTQRGVKDIVDYYDDNSQGDAIYSVFIAPKAFFSNFTDVTLSIGSGTAVVNLSVTVNDVMSPVTLTVSKVNYLGKNYIPRNNKLLTFPYCFLQVSNNNGSIVNYYWEEFNKIVTDPVSTTIKFNLRGCLTPGCSFAAYPVNYKNIMNNYDESITLGKFPIGGWNTDVYTNWLTANSINIATSITADVGSTVLGGVTVAGGKTLGSFVGGTGGVLSGITGIASTIGTIYQHSLIPNQARGNTNVGDYSYSYGLTELVFKRISIKNEYAAIIDSYFDMFGYKVNMLKTPNFTSRPYWNFLKTIDCNCDGDIPQEDLSTIRKACDSGITFWKLPQYIYDYSKDNRIVPV